MITTVVLLVAFEARAAASSGFSCRSATGLILSTVYCRYHYGVDVLAGLALAVATVPLGDAIYDRCERRGAAFRDDGLSSLDGGGGPRAVG